jgi:hypothetical protein
MRLALTLALLATPLHAWEFTPTPVCTLTHETPEADLRVTYDPARPEPYAIAITRSAPWPDGPSFAIRYDGLRPFTITTGRHRLSNGSRTLTVTDRGFDNLLDGLEFNATATALTNGLALPFPLAGAAEPVRAFRACAEAPTA